MSSRATGLALAVAIFLLSGPMPARGEEVQPAYPGQPCAVKPKPELQWRAQEEWVWTEICNGRQANLNRRRGGIPMPSEDEMDLPTDRLMVRFMIASDRFND